MLNYVPHLSQRLSKPQNSNKNNPPHVLSFVQIFEAYGLGEDVIETSFCGSVSRIGGMSLADLQAEAESFHAKAFPDKAMSKLQDYGFIQSRAKGTTRPRIFCVFR